MKHFLLLAVFLLASPVVAQAAFSDDVDLDPVSVDFCGSGEVTISGEYSFLSGFSNGQRNFEVKLDGTTVFSDGSNPNIVDIPFSFTETVGVGEHEVFARTFVTILSSDTKATDTITFTVPECEPEPVDVCPNIDGDQATMPDGYHDEGGMCIEDEEEPEPPTCGDGEHLEGDACVPDEEPEEGGGGGDSEESAPERSGGGSGSGMSSPWYYFPVAAELRDAFKELWARNPLIDGIPLRKVVIYQWCLKHFDADSCHLPAPVE